MDVKQIMAKQDLNTEGYVPNAKDLPLLQGKPKILIDESAVDMFNAIKNGVKINNYNKVAQETSFILIGYEDTASGLIYIKSCVPAMQTFDVFTGSNFKSWDFVNKCVDIAQQYSDHGKPIIFFGHTHPALYVTNKQGKEVPCESANCWSSQDLLSISVFKSLYQDKVQVADMLITPSLDINTIYLETSKGVEGFYRFDAVLTYNKSKDCYEKEKSYSDINAPFVKLNPRELEN